MQGQICNPSAVQHTAVGPSISLASVFGNQCSSREAELSVDHRCHCAFSVNRVRAFILEEPKKRPKDANL
jgi:hypothetical protein